MSSVLPDIKFNLSLVISDQDGIMNTFQYTRTLRAGQLQEGRTSFLSAQNYIQKDKNVITCSLSPLSWAMKVRPIST